MSKTDKKTTKTEDQEETVTRNKVAKIVRLSISVGDEDSDRLLPEYVEAIKEALSGIGKNVTVDARHYLIMDGAGRGQYCKEADYDPNTRDYRPGAGPPSWAGGSVESRRVEAQQSAPEGTRDPVNLRTVSETLAARKKTTGKKMKVRAGSETGDRQSPVSAPQSAPTAAETAEVTKTVQSAESGAEKTANSASAKLLAKLRAK